MQVAKITLWDGAEYFTNQFDAKSLRTFFSNAREKYIKENLDTDQDSEIEIIEMTEEEYAAIPATNYSAKLFGQTSN